MRWRWNAGCDSRRWRVWNSPSLVSRPSPRNSFAHWMPRPLTKSCWRVTSTSLMCVRVLEQEHLGARRSGSRRRRRSALRGLAAGTRAGRGGTSSSEPTSGGLRRAGRRGSAHEPHSRSEGAPCRSAKGWWMVRRVTLSTWHRGPPSRARRPGAGSRDARIVAADLRGRGVRPSRPAAHRIRGGPRGPGGRGHRRGDQPADPGAAVRGRRRPGWPRSWCGRPRAGSTPSGPAIWPTSRAAACRRRPSRASWPTC